MAHSDFYLSGPLTEHLGQKLNADDDFRLGVLNCLHFFVCFEHQHHAAVLAKTYQCGGSISKNWLIYLMILTYMQFGGGGRLEVWGNFGPPHKTCKVIIFFTRSLAHSLNYKPNACNCELTLVCTLLSFGGIFSFAFHPMSSILSTPLEGEKANLLVIYNIWEE